MSDETMVRRFQETGAEDYVDAHGLRYYRDSQHLGEHEAEAVAEEWRESGFWTLVREVEGQGWSVYVAAVRGEYAEVRSSLGTQTEVAEALGLSHYMSLAKREQGSRTISREHWLALLYLAEHPEMVG